MSDQVLDRAKSHFEKLVKSQIERVEKMKQAEDWVDYSDLSTIKVGVCWGDGIGPIISQETQRLLEYLLTDEVKSGKIKFIPIEGLTIENRAKHMKAIPDDVLDELKTCHVILKRRQRRPKKVINIRT